MIDTDYVVVVSPLPPECAFELPVPENVQCCFGCCLSVKGCTA